MKPHQSLKVFAIGILIPFCGAHASLGLRCTAGWSESFDSSSREYYGIELSDLDPLWPIPERALVFTTYKNSPNVADTNPTLKVDKSSPEITLKDNQLKIAFAQGTLNLQLKKGHVWYRPHAPTNKADGTFSMNGKDVTTQCDFDDEKPLMSMGAGFLLASLEFQKMLQQARASIGPKTRINLIDIEEIPDVKNRTQSVYKINLEKEYLTGWPSQGVAWGHIEMRIQHGYGDNVKTSVVSAAYIPEPKPPVVPIESPEF